MLRFKRPLSPLKSAGSVKLFSKYDLVDNYNRACLLRFPGYLYEFKANDSGQKSELNKVAAPEILWPKINCPVILVKTISAELVNGLIGRLRNITGKGVVVELPAAHITKTIESTDFTGGYL